MKHNSTRLQRILSAVIAPAVAILLVVGCAHPTAPDQDVDDPGKAPLPDSDVLEWDSITIDFDQATAGFVGENFDGTGLAPGATVGQLDSNGWQVSGLSDGETDWGSQMTDGDYARGASPGGVSTGGLYAFEVSEGNTALGVQPTSGDLAPGSITLRYVLAETQTEEIEISYDLYWLNDQDRSTVWSVQLSADGESWIDVPQCSMGSPETADPGPVWSSSRLAAQVDAAAEGLVLVPGGMLYVRWTIADGEGSGGRDETAIDDVQLRLGRRPAARTWRPLAGALR